MAIERGFRRIVTVFSIAALCLGLAFTALLVGAWAWTNHIEKQTGATLVAEGCVFANREPPAELRLEPLGARRWRVTIPERGYTAVYVVKADRELSAEEVMGSVRAVPRDFEAGLGRRHPTPGIEVVNCLFLSEAMYAVDRAEPSMRLFLWWLERSGVLWAMAWLSVPGFAFQHEWLLVPATLIPALLCTGAVAAIPWGLFYLVRWIAQGFTRP